MPILKLKDSEGINMRPESNWRWLDVPDSAKDLFDKCPAVWWYVQKAKEKELQGITFSQLAKNIDRTERNTRHSLSKAKSILLMHGINCYSDDSYQNEFVPPPHYLKGVSTYFKIDENGEKTPVAQWHKTDIKKQEREQPFIEFVEEATSGIKPFKRVAQPKTKTSDKCTVYTLTDFHLGMYAWADESGDDWDMEIAEKVMLSAFQDMMDGSPDSEQAVFAQLGDLLHWDGMLPVTVNAKNILDADTRFPRLVQSAINLMIKSVEMLLHKHKNVHVIMAEGNHDQASSVWLRAIMGAMFSKNPRVTIDQSPFPYYAFVFHDIFLAWHHGHLTRKLDDLILRFTTEWRDDFGRCNWTYIHTGHKHTKEVIERAGIYIEQHPTLAARDSYAARNFLTSKRGATAITYAKDVGEYSRITVRPRISK